MDPDTVVVIDPDEQPDKEVATADESQIDWKAL